MGNFLTRMVVCGLGSQCQAGNFPDESNTTPQPKTPVTGRQVLVSRSPGDANEQDSMENADQKTQFAEEYSTMAAQDVSSTGRNSNTLLLADNIPTQVAQVALENNSPSKKLQKKIIPKSPSWMDTLKNWANDPTDNSFRKVADFQKLVAKSEFPVKACSFLPGKRDPDGRLIGDRRRLGSKLDSLLDEECPKFQLLLREGIRNHILQLFDAFNIAGQGEHQGNL